MSAAPASSDASLRRASAADRSALVALQEAAYAPNAVILGGQPIPLTWDYAEVLDTCEVWVVDGLAGLDAALILRLNPADLYIESVSVAPTAQGRQLGNRLLDLAEARAREQGRSVLRLITGQKLARNVDWYGRRGFTIERIERRPDRDVVHMIRQLG